ncbi:MAG TPA: iron-sulfur cluster repair di-iron protein [Armatimonadota bacterium]|nr:iron-sulfur cluster repair di-iron protein [Armatimonadota bacterium]
MNITPETSVARIAAQSPATVRIFQRFDIDFCCGGKRPLGEVCAEKQVTFQELRSALEAVESAPDELPSADAPLSELIRIVLDRYHASLRQELPRLGEMSAKVLRVHGDKHPEMLPALDASFRRLREELEGHMPKEERVLFPYIEQLETVAAQGAMLQGSPFGTIQAPIGTMEHEHEAAARELALLRELTSGFQPPAGACNTFRGLYHGLSELDRELREHIHLENNVIFPRAVELETRLRAH